MIYKKLNDEKNEIGTEYTPQEEISEEQLRQTMITLYFKEKETGKITPEARKIDANLLAKDPYLYLLTELVNGPKNERLEKLIPDGTKVNKIELKGSVLWIDFSKEFVQNVKEGDEEKVIESIVNTLTELNEISSVKILIEGEEGKGFLNGDINFNSPFERGNQVS